MNMDREIVDLYVDDIIPNRFQPREIFDDKALKELSASIKEHGVIQPIIVRKIGEKYEIIAGERRYKASVMAGLTKIPAIIRNLDDKESSKVALLENLQRRDLTAIEEARTYQKILDLDSMTQEELGQTMGKSQAAIANKLRLLSLPDEVQEALLTGQISERHARSLLNVKDKQKQIELLNKIVATRMTVRELDTEIKNLSSSSDDQEGSSGEEKTIPTGSAEETVSIPDMNPVIQPYQSLTNVDINEIKNQTSDIIERGKPEVNISDLLRVTPKEETTPAQEKPEIVPTNDFNNFDFTPQENNPENNFNSQEFETNNQDFSSPVSEERTFKFLPPIEEEEENKPEETTQTPNLDFLSRTPIYSSEPTATPLTTVEEPKELPENKPEEEQLKPIIIDDIENLDDEQKQANSNLGYQPFTNTESLLNEYRQNNNQGQNNSAEMISSIPSVKEEMEPVEPPQKINELKQAINRVRDLVKELESSGFVVDVDEMDFENKYQFNIKIDKNK